MRALLFGKIMFFQLIIFSQISRIDSLLLKENMIYVSEENAYYIESRNDRYYETKILSICKIPNGYIIKGLIRDDRSGKDLEIYIISPSYDAKNDKNETNIEINKTYKIKLIDYYLTILYINWHCFMYNCYKINYFLIGDKLLHIPIGKCFVARRIYITPNIRGLKYNDEKKIDTIYKIYQEEEDKIRQHIIEFIRRIRYNEEISEFVDSSAIVKIYFQKKDNYYGGYSVIRLKKGEKIIFQKEFTTKFNKCDRYDFCDICKHLPGKANRIHKRKGKINLNIIIQKILEYQNEINTELLSEKTKLRLLYADENTFVVEVDVPLKSDIYKKMLFVASVKKKNDSYLLNGIHFDFAMYNYRMKYE